MPQFPKNELAQTVIASCIANGIAHVVISPGSRNAPLTIGFTNALEIQNYSIVDERCAAFFALGIAQQLKNPRGLLDPFFLLDLGTKLKSQYTNTTRNQVKKEPLLHHGKS